MPKEPRFDDADAKKMVAMHKEGKTIGLIASAMNTTSATVSKYLVKAGAHKPKPRKKRKGKAAKTGAKAGRIPKILTMTMEEIHAKLKAAQADVKRFSKLLKKTVKREEAKFKKMKRGLGIK